MLIVLAVVKLTFLSPSAWLLGVFSQLIRNLGREQGCHLLAPWIPTVELSYLQTRPTQFGLPTLSASSHTTSCPPFYPPRTSGCLSFLSHFLQFSASMPLIVIPSAAYPLTPTALLHQLMLIHYLSIMPHLKEHLIQEVFPGCHLPTTLGSVWWIHPPYCFKMSISHH